MSNLLSINHPSIDTTPFFLSSTNDPPLRITKCVCTFNPFVFFSFFESKFTPIHRRLDWWRCEDAGRAGCRGVRGGEANKWPKGENWLGG